ncbi:stalk domain-containing protein [Gudongella sp. SC589]|jgi:hypothetical protein|uniref:stalk domain-containing protein n=1 Tax=Gudongella sp. SC589 TaxID=3385990 RepID=UPI0039047A77
MNNKRNRRIAIIIAVLMLTMAFSTTGFAAWMGKTIEAQYRNVTIFVNNQYKQATDVNGKVIEPFIYEGTTYVPLRGISQMLGYEVSFNPQTYRIDITGSGVDPSAQYEILILQARIAELEAKLEEKSSYSLDDMQKDLNDDYTRFTRNVSIDEIILKGKTDDIEIRVYVNLNTNAAVDYWKNAYDDGDVKSTIQKMVDDVLDQFPDADIEGYVEDDFDDSKLATFTVSSRGVVSISKSSSTSSTTLSDLVDYLEDEYVGFGGIEEIKAYGSTTGTIFLDVFVYKRDWDRLSSGDQEDLMDDIIYDVEYDFPKATIDGLIIDNDTEKTLDTFKN